MESIRPDTTESQSHGKTIENNIKINIYLVNGVYSHTSVHDINSTDNNITGKNVSVKTSGSSKKIDCGDILRFLELNNTEIVVAFYNQEGDCKDIKRTFVVDYDKFLEQLKVDIKSKFNIDFEDWVKSIVEYDRNVKNIPNGRVEDKDKWYKLNKPPTPYYFNICPKVGSKNQRRVQCSITDFTDFIIQDNEGSILHGKKYDNKYCSPKRIRHNKNT